jgi:exopolyphosphatase/guanosine-5'-triphosphate,3'-diphosphate pyrophosphatase
MLIATRDTGSGFVPLLKERAIVRLGEGYGSSLRISTEAINRGINTLTGFTSKMSENGVGCCSAMATGIVRKAMNASEFLTRVRNECGLLVKVISGDEEAMLTLKGVELVFPKAKRKGAWVIFDIGGGSTELIYGEDGGVKIIESMDLGVVTLADLLNFDPPLQEELKAINREVEKVLRPVGERIRDQAKGKDFFLIGTAGTVTTLAAMDQALLEYQSEKINGFLLKEDSVKDIYGHLIRLHERKREELPGLEKGRGKLIIPGCAILLGMMDLFQVASVSVSDFGLLEGITTELFESLDSPTKLG